MYARVITAQARPTAFKRIDVYKENVVPTAKKLSGYKGSLLLSNHETGKFISISLWDTKENMKSSAAISYLREQGAKFATVLAAPPTSESFEIEYQV